MRAGTNAALNAANITSAGEGIHLNSWISALSHRESQIILAGCSTPQQGTCLFGKCVCPRLNTVNQGRSLPFRYVGVNESAYVRWNFQKHLAKIIHVIILSSSFFFFLE